MSPILKSWALLTSIIIITNTLSIATPLEFDATLKSHIILPASDTLIPPTDVPVDLKNSGKYTELSSLNRNKKIEGLNEGRPTGQFVPIHGQPVQGFSGIKNMGNNIFWILTDNGAGTKNNSSDFMLYLNQFQLDFPSNTAKYLKTIYLHDPDHKIPFRIVHENTLKRYLTGADIDPESFQWVNNTLWIGEEFGPFLIKASAQGKIIKIFETKINQQVIQSPDNPLKPPIQSPDQEINFNLKKSKGFEGLALSKDKSKLYALLEGPIYDLNYKQYENLNSKTVLKILEFDLKKEQWTGRFWLYPLENENNAIGDFNMISTNTALVIERDNLQGTTQYPCTTKQQEKCFPNPAQFKRVYKIRFNENNVNHSVDKLAYVDLLKIKDPLHISKKSLVDNYFVFPFLTIENVDIVNQHQIIVANDNNYPFNANRQPNLQDDNEIILLEVGDFLKSPE